MGVSAPIMELGRGTPQLRRDEIHYSDKDLLGRGGFGSVYSGTCRGMTVAVKVCRQRRILRCNLW